MDATQAAILLEKASRYDGRDSDPEAAYDWAEVLEDINFDDAMTAVKRHVQISKWPITPAEVREGVHNIERERVAAAPNVYELEPPSRVADLEGDEHDAAYLAWVQETSRRIRRGEPLEVGPERVRLTDADRMKELTESVATAHRAS